MKKRLLAVLLCLSFALPAIAQDTTPEAPVVTDPVVVSTEEAPDVTVIVEAPAPLTPAEGIDLANVLWGLLIALVGGGSFAFVLHSLDKREKDILERAFQSLPPSAQETIKAGVSLSEQALVILGRVADILEVAVSTGKQVTDGLPNVDTPPDAAASTDVWRSHS